MKSLIFKKIVLKAEFYDVDSMNVVWHGNYAKYLESARCALLDEIGYNYTSMKNDGYAYPIVKMQIKYIRPIFFNDLIEIEARLVEVSGFLKFNYIIKNLNSNQKISEASTSQMAVRLSDFSSCFELPDEILNAIKRYQNENNINCFTNI